MKLNQDNKEISAPLNLGNKANLISQSYVAQLLFNIWDSTLTLATINKQKMCTQSMVCASFGITNNANDSC